MKMIHVDGYNQHKLLTNIKLRKTFNAEIGYGSDLHICDFNAVPLSLGDIKPGSASG
jgi:hypothetical protein